MFRIYIYLFLIAEGKERERKKACNAKERTHIRN